MAQLKNENESLMAQAGNYRRVASLQLVDGRELQLLDRKPEDIA